MQKDALQNIEPQAITRGLRPMFGRVIFINIKWIFFGSRRCLRRPGFDSYFAPIIKFIRPDYYQCFLSNRDIMVFFGQLWLLVTMHGFYAKRQTKAEKAGEKMTVFILVLADAAGWLSLKKSQLPKQNVKHFSTCIEIRQITATFISLYWNHLQENTLFLFFLASCY